MKVKDLIAKLSSMNPEMRVVVNGDTGTSDPPVDVGAVCQLDWVDQEGNDEVVVCIGEDLGELLLPD